MYLDSVCIYDSVVTAHRRKIKTRFAFFDEVFHQTSFAVKFDRYSGEESMFVTIKVYM